MSQSCGRLNPVTGTMCAAGILAVLGLLSVPGTLALKHSYPRKLFDPRQNVWVSLAHELNTTTFCASLATPSTPFLTCLIGVPLTNTTWLHFRSAANDTGFQSGRITGNNITESFEQYDNWDDRLPFGPEPQEIELIDSLNATSCFYIDSRNSPCSEGTHTNCWKNTSIPTWLSPIGNSSEWEKSWCNHTGRTREKPAPGTVLPRRLPPGYFLICGNRAWSGIPTLPVGGPCTIGQLSLALPQHHPNRTHPTRWQIGRAHV